MLCSVSIMSRSNYPLRLGLMVMLLFYLYIGANGSSNAAGEPKIRSCLEVERQALLNIKEALLEIQEGFLSSWGNEEEKRDCCEWYGVQCANNSDHVTVLDLAPSTSPIYDEYSYNLRRYLRGTISPSLRELKHLTYLDLSLINFTGHGIPSFIGTLTKLRYLNLSYAEMSGEIPPQVGNLSSLEVLDLGYNNDLRMKSTGWVSHLFSLRLLDLSSTNMSQATDWWQVVNKLPHLMNLQLVYCNLPDVTSSSLSLVNSSTSLAILDLSSNGLSVSIYQWVLSFSRSLVHLDLSSNALEGSIPEAFGNMTSLTYLYLGYNDFLKMKSTGWVSHLFSLRLLDLSWTNMSQATDWWQVVNKLPHLMNLQLVYCNLPNVTSSSLSLVNSSTSLAILDLSENGLSVSIYQWVLSFSRSLVHLDLSSNALEGSIPEAFGNMTSLTYLDLGYNDFLKMKSTGWVSHLSSLRLLDLSITNMSQATDWWQVVNKLPHLMNLQLVYCNLPNVTSSSLSLVNSSTSLAILDLSENGLSVSIYQWVLSFSRSLVHLDLSYNALGGSIPEAFGNMTSLVHLGLSSNKFEGPIPEALGNLTKLTDLLLENNHLKGPIPEALGNLTKLTYLYLGYNRFGGSLPNLTIFPSLEVVFLSGNQYNGTVPETIGQLTQLEYLYLDWNSLEGVITEAHFSKLTKLSRLDLSHNSLTLKFDDHWVPPFQLDSISLRSCKLGPQFPRWLQTQNKLSMFDISNSGISDSIPDWLWDISSECSVMNLSNNQINGKIKSYSLEFQGLPEIDLSSNRLEGSIPPFLFNVGALDLSTNRFSRLSSICNVTNDSSLGFLDISFNQFSGEIPDCWSPFKQLIVLILANNEFSGDIPISIGSLTGTKTLHLGNNSLTKELPSSMKNCTNLMALGVGENRLEGPIPTWIGESLTELIVLSLRSNHFSGSIPSQLCHLPNLQLLDLSSNNISGSVPRCLKNLTAMKKSRNDKDTFIMYEYLINVSGARMIEVFLEEVDLVWKGKVSKFDKILGLVKSIDLSSNKLIGEIPTEITELNQLVSLNLSRNKFSGRIPSEIGNLALLDALDLSNNQLYGGIPSSLTEVAGLNVLDLSNNHLYGKIPTGTQLQSFEASSYAGNPELCGAPLLKRCPSDEPTVSTAAAAHNEEDQDKFVTRGFYVTLGLGFVVGFWGVCGTLIFSETWRYSYFNFLNDVNDWIYVHKAKLLRIIKN